MKKKTKKKKITYILSIKIKKKHSKINFQKKK